MTSSLCDSSTERALSCNSSSRGVRFSVLALEIFYIFFTAPAVNLLTSVRGLCQHGVRRGLRGEEKLSVSGAEAGRAPQEETADEFGRQDEQNRGQRQKRV